jgi:hypothetical protein
MVNVKAINDERMGRWKVKLNRVNATPVFLMGVGHDHNQGQLTIYCTEDRTDEELLLFLEEAAKQLREQIANKN